MITEDEKILEQFPKYKDGGYPFVGTREYWESVFESETNRDTELHTAFGDLHEKIVNEVILFCKEHNINDAFSFSISADGLGGSIRFGKWGPCTDSSMSIFKNNSDKKPFLHEI